MEAVSRHFPLPVTLRHIMQSLLACLDSGPDVSVALVRVASHLGSRAASRHILPPLLDLLTSSAVHPSATEQRFRPPGETISADKQSLRPSSLSLPCGLRCGTLKLQVVQHEDVSLLQCCATGRTPESAAMLGAVTVVEGLLPCLPENVILQQLVRLEETISRAVITTVFQSKPKVRCPCCAPSLCGHTSCKN